MRVAIRIEPGRSAPLPSRTARNRSTAIRKLLAEGLEEWRRERALEKLEAGDVSFARAAEIAGMSIWDFPRLARDRDVAWVSSDHAEAHLEDL